MAEERKAAAGIGLDDVFWIVASLYIIQYFDILDAVMFDPRIHPEFFRAAKYLMGASVGCGAVCAIVLDWWYKIDYEKAYPKAIPAITTLGLGGTLCFWRAMWPVWHFWSLLIIPTLFMGFIISLTLIPKC